MGNVCCGAKEESPKPSAFASGFSVDSNSLDQTAASSHQASATGQQPTSFGDSPGAHGSRLALAASGNQDGNEVDKETSEEEQRLELLVQTAGRAMVAVRSTRGNNPYYDQGFAAALAQHLEQTTQFPDYKPPLPAAPSGGTFDEDGNSYVYKRLSQPAWEDLSLGSKGGLAGCAGENPEKYLDHVAESFLDHVVPKKEQLFAKAKPIMESLL